MQASPEAPAWLYPEADHDPNNLTALNLSKYTIKRTRVVATRDA